MVTTIYKAGQRPRVRVRGLPTGRDTATLVRINSKTAYVRSPFVVGELAYSLADPDTSVEIIRHPDGRPVLETEQWPPLTPYDRGERLEPDVWVLPDRRRPEEHDPDRYGKVDFNDDEGATVATLWVERGADGKHTIRGYTHGDDVAIDIHIEE